MVNHGKSKVLIAGIEDRDLEIIYTLFPFYISSIEVGFKYLGFRLKPTTYKNKDWNLLKM